MIVPWAADYVGIPYERGGRSREGADCWGLVWMVQLGIFGNDVPLLSEGVHPELMSREHFQAIVVEQKELWKEVDNPQPGDTILFWTRREGDGTHVGTLVGPHHFLDMPREMTSCITDLSRDFWRRRIMGYFRFNN